MLSDHISLLFAGMVFILLFLVLFILLYFIKKNKVCSKEVTTVVIFYTVCNILIEMLFLFIFNEIQKTDIKIDRWYKSVLLILTIYYVGYVLTVITCLINKFQVNKVRGILFGFSFISVSIFVLSFSLSFGESTRSLNGSVYEYQVSTVDSYSGILGEDLGSLQVYYDSNGSIFLDKSDLSIINKDYSNIEFKDRDINYIRATDQFWSYNGNSFIPKSSLLDGLNSELVDISILYSDGTLKKYKAKSIKFLIIDEDTVYCMASDNYSNIFTVFSIK